MRLGNVEALPYKTTLLGGRWELGEGGIRVFGALWLIPAVGFGLAGAALMAGWAWLREHRTLECGSTSSSRRRMTDRFPRL